MLRKLLPVSGLVLLALPASVFGLGIGEIRSSSFLNQPFQAEIEILGVKPTELDTVKVRLASDKDFAKTGAIRAHFLDQLRFEPKVTDSGRTVISVTSSQPVREPFVDFLVEINWPQGRLVKEYTVLLDPPATIPGLAPPPVVPATVPAPPRVQPARPAPRPARRAGRREVPAVRGAAPSSYGPVRRGDTLWSISKRFNVPGASHRQVLEALFAANPEAFINNDMNKLKTGAVLSLGASDSAPSSADPMRGAAERAVDRRAPQEHRLRIAAPRDEAGPRPGGAESGPGEQAARGLAPIERDLNLVREQSESTRQETEELSGRIQDLEAQLKDVRKLLELRNAQLAELQVALGATPETGAVPDPASAGQTTEPGGQPVPAGGSAGPMSGAPQEGPPIKARDVPAADAKQPVTARQSAEGAPREEAVADTWWEDPTRWLEGIAAAPLSPAALGAAALGLLLLLGYSVSRRRRAGETESIPLDQPAPEPVRREAIGQPIAEPAAGAVARERDNQWRTEFRTAPVEQPTAGEDVLAEVDVYLEFERFKEAEALLRDALSQHPDRQELRMKLAEVYHHAGDGAAFGQLLEELRSGDRGPLDAKSLDRLAAMAAGLGIPLDLDEGRPAAPGPAPQPGPLADTPTVGTTPAERGAERDIDLDMDLNLGAALREMEELGPAVMADDQGHPFGRRPTGAPEVIDWPADFAAELAREKEDSGGGSTESGETEIKLDLARAYLAMDDKDGARSILEEILKTAQGEQKSEAERLLASLA